VRIRVVAIRGEVLIPGPATVADELAATAELVTGKLLGVPVALIKGYPYERMEDADSRDIVRDPDKDLFR